MIKVSKTKLKDVLIVQPEIFEDFRGYFVEMYNESLYHKNGVRVAFVQDNISVSSKNVLRGIHGDQKTWKLISCARGKIYFVAVNCDKSSKKFGAWESFILSSVNRRQILVPPKYGSSYFVLSDEAVVNYKQSTYYSLKEKFSYRWDEPRFNIRWPRRDPILSEKDLSARYI